MDQQLTSENRLDDLIGDYHELKLNASKRLQHKFVINWRDICYVEIHWIEFYNKWAHVESGPQSGGVFLQVSVPLIFNLVFIY